MSEQVEIGGISWDPSDTATLNTTDIPHVVEAVVADNQRIIDEVKRYVLQKHLEALGTLTGNLTLAVDLYSLQVADASRIEQIAQTLAGDSVK